MRRMFPDSRSIAVLVVVVMAEVSLVLPAQGTNAPLIALKGIGQTVDQEFDRVVNFTVAVVFVGYDERCVDVEEITICLKMMYSREILLPPKDPALRYDRAGTVWYDLSFDFFFSNESYTQTLNDFVSRQSREGLTSDLDVEALLEQRRTGRRMKVFFPIRGISVDAVALENWLQQNPCTAPPVPGYTIYMLNLSHLDSSDGSTVHWFDPSIRDPDSKRTIQWFEYGVGVELYLDLPVYPAYAGWGNASRLFFLDPSAHQWYLKWTAVWGEERTWDLPYGHDLTGLTEFVKDRDIYGPDGRAALSRYLALWIDELADGLVRRDHGIHRFYRDTLVDVLILNGAQGMGITNEELAWITSREALSPVMTDIDPFTEWRFNIRIRDIESYPRLKQAVLESSTRVDGRLHVVASDVWSFLVGETASMFNLGAADRVIACLIIVMNNTIMVLEGPEGKEAVAGMGAGGRVLVMMEPSGFYFPGNETRRIGLTWLLVHELGHNLGLGHMHLSTTRATYCADFAGEVMGRLSCSKHFTKFMRDSFQRNTFDYIYVQMMRDITQIQDLGKREIVQGVMEQAVLLYDNMSYLDALYKLREAERIISGEVAVVTTTITVTRVQTHTSEKTLTYTLTATVTTTVRRGAGDPGIVVLLLVLLLTVAPALTVIWIASQRSTKR